MCSCPASSETDASWSGPRLAMVARSCSCEKPAGVHPAWKSAAMPHMMWLNFAFSFHISVMSFGVSSFFGMSILAPFPSSHDLGVFLSLSLDLFVFAISLSMYMLLSAILCTYVRITWAFYVFPSLSRCPFLSFSPSSFIASSRSLCLHVLLSPSPFSIFLLFFYSSSLPTYVRTYLS